MSNTEKDKQANEQVEDDDEPDEWFAACSLLAQLLPLIECRDKRIFSTGCSGMRQ